MMVSAATRPSLLGLPYYAGLLFWLLLVLLKRRFAFKGAVYPAVALWASLHALAMHIAQLPWAHHPVARRRVRHWLGLDVLGTGDSVWEGYVTSSALAVTLVLLAVSMHVRRLRGAVFVSSGLEQPGSALSEPLLKDAEAQEGWGGGPGRANEDDTRSGEGTDYGGSLGDSNPVYSSGMYKAAGQGYSEDGGNDRDDAAETQSVASEVSAAGHLAAHWASVLVTKLRHLAVAVLSFTFKISLVPVLVIAVLYCSLPVLPLAVYFCVGVIVPSSVTRRTIAWLVAYVHVWALVLYVTAAVRGPAPVDRDFVPSTGLLRFSVPLLGFSGILGLTGVVAALVRIDRRKAPHAYPPDGNDGNGNDGDHADDAGGVTTSVNLNPEEAKDEAAQGWRAEELARSGELVRVGSRPSAAAAAAAGASRSQSLRGQPGHERPPTLLAVAVVALKLALYHYSYVCSLALLFSLAVTSVDIFHAIYLAFFLAFLNSQPLARRFWVVLVLFTNVVVFLLYLWQVPLLSLPADVNNEYGLVRFEKVYPTVARPLALVFGLAEPLALLLFALVQWQVYKIVVVSGDVLPARISAGLTLFRAACLGFYRVVGLPAVYLAALVVGLSPNVQLLRIIYVIIVFATLVVQIQFIRRGLAGVRVMLFVLASYSAAVIALKYAFQFQVVHRAVVQGMHTATQITPQDLGLIGDTPLSAGTRFDVLRFFIPDAIVLVLTVLQLRWLRRVLQGPAAAPPGAGADPNDAFAVERPRALAALYRFCARCAFLHAPKAVVISLLAASVERGTVSVIGMVFLLMALAILLVPWLEQRAWPAVSLVVIAAGIVQLLFVFPFALQQSLSADQLRWVGLTMQGVTKDQFFWPALFPAATLVALAVQRISAAPYRGRDSPTLFKWDPSLPEELVVNEPIAVMLPRAKRFFSTFFDRYGLGLAVFSLLIVAFTRPNFFTVLFVVVAAGCVYFSRRAIRRVWPVLVGFQVLIILGQYTYVLLLVKIPFSCCEIRTQWQDDTNVK